MALKYPDILQHNNPAYALMNATELRGTSYPITNLADTGSIPTDKRALGAIVFISSTQEFYGYYGQTTSSVDWSTAGNWRALASGISSLAGYITTGSASATQAITGSLTLSGSFKLDIPSKANNYVLTSDANGNATWASAQQASSIGFVTTGSSTATQAITGSLIVSSSLAVTGSLRVSGSTFINLGTSASVTNVVMINPTTGQLYYTASSAIQTSVVGYVTTSSFNSFTSSVVTTSSFNAFTSSVVTTSSFNSFTGSVTTTSSFNAFTGSVVTTSSFNSFTGSVTTTSSFNNFTSSVVTTSSFNSFTSSAVTTSSFNSFTGSVVTTSSFNSFTGSVVTTSSFNTYTASVSLQAVTNVGSSSTKDIAVDSVYIKPGAGYLTDWAAALTYLGDGSSAAGRLRLRESSTGNGKVATLTVGDLNDNRIINLPNAPGTLLMTINNQEGDGNGNINLTGVGQTYYAGPGISIGTNNYISSSIITVNGVGPTNGNIATTLTAVTTGVSQSLFLSSSGVITGSLANGLVWIVSGDGTPANNGDTYIYVSGAVGQWYPINPLDTAAADARYLKLDAGNDPMTGELNMGANSIVNIQKLGVGTQTPTATLQVIDSSSFVYQQTPTAGTIIGRQGSGSTFLVHTPSLNTTYGSGLVVTGSYAGTKANVELTAFGPYSFGGYNADMVFKTSYETGISEVLRLSRSESVGRVIASGSVGINVSKPLGNLHVSGTVFLPNVTSSTTTLSNVLMISSSGQIFTTASSAFGSGGSSAPTFYIATGSVSASVNVGTNNIFTLTSGSTPRTFMAVSSSGLTKFTFPDSSINKFILNNGASDHFAIASTNNYSTVFSSYSGSGLLPHLSIGLGATVVSPAPAIDNHNNMLAATAASSSLFRIYNKDSSTLNFDVFSNGNVKIGNVTNDLGYRLAVTGSGISGSFNVNNILLVSQSTVSVTGSTNVLKVIGSGSTQPLFSVIGSQGELFAVTDSLTGSLFSVNDISGLPILDVNSDQTIKMGTYLAPSLNATSRVTVGTTGTVIYQLPTALYDAMFWEMWASSGSIKFVMGGQTLWSGSVANMDSQYYNTAYGDPTLYFTFSAGIAGGNFRMAVTGSTNGWTVKTIIRAI